MKKIKRIIFIIPLFFPSFIFSYSIEKVISREHPFFNIKYASFTVGKDGKIYFFNPISERWDGFIYRVNRDGSDKSGINVGYGGSVNVTANSEGIIAEASAHFRHSVTIYDKNFKKLYEISDFLVNDTVGWDSPGHIETGESGDFYALDQNRDRILRISPKGKIEKIYKIPKIEKTKCYDFRVCENKQSFYLLYWGRPLICIDFNGIKKWEYNVSRNFDVDEGGNLYFIDPQSDIVNIVNYEGNLVGKIKLEIEKTQKPLNKYPINGLRIYKKEIFLKRDSEIDFFEIYSLTNGEFVKNVEIAYEKIKVGFPSLIWKIGEQVPLKIDFISKSENKIDSPLFHIYIKPIEFYKFIELRKNEKNEVYIPKINPGIYFLFISSDLNPEYQNCFEYTIFTPILIKENNSKGIILLNSPSNRIFYGRGEPINFYIKVGGNKNLKSLKLKLYKIEDQIESNLIYEEEVFLSNGVFQIPGEITEILQQGVYLLKTEESGYTNIGQIIVIGDNNIKKDDEFKIVNYGDYGLTFPRKGNINFVFLAPQKILNHIEKSKKLGINLFVDRLGYPVNFYALKWEPGWGETGIFDEIKKIMKEENFNLEEETELLSPFLQVLSAYSAFGIKQMNILLGNDAGLPLGTGFDNRKPEELLKVIEEQTKIFSSFSSFRGWIWASNWWIFYDRGANVLKESNEKEKYLQALKELNEKGKWDSILEKAAMMRLGYGVDAIKIFNEKLEEITYRLKTAVACPFRNVESYPPVTMAEVDECDLQAQWEQIPPPYYAPFNVDFYKRPNKKDIAHPEIWNDSGTGEQIIPTLFSLIMRGGESVGNSGYPLPWGNLKRDKRSSYYGTLSIYRFIYNFMKEYGPWLTKLRNYDKVAILADGRMYKIDDWGHFMGVHFARVFEGYLTCLFAHRPATIIFSEDVKRDTFKNYKVILIIDQRVEFEENVLNALKEAQKSGVKIYYDETCNKEIVKEFLPLGIGFNKIEKDHSLHSDDHAYWRVKNYIFDNLSYLKRIFEDLENEAEIEEPEVFITEKIGEKEKYIFVVNLKNSDIGPEFLWRTTINVATTLPLKIPLKFRNLNNYFIYDITELEEIKPNGEGKFECDLSNLPFRIYALLPQKIKNIEILYPNSVSKGSKLNIRVRILDEKNNPVRAIIPLKVTLYDEKNKKIFEDYSYVDFRGKNLEIVIPFNLNSQKINLSATELISGKKCNIDINLLPFQENFSLFKKISILTKKPDTMKKEGISDKEFMCCREKFGPKINNFTFNLEKSKILVTTTNWDKNLYCLDLNNGKILWNKKIGHHFAVSPKNFGENFIVEGFDYYSSEGYHLYLLEQNKGEIIKKFAFYGIPQRLCHRFVPGIIRDSFDQWDIDEKGQYIALSGNFGIVVWDKEENLVWRKDWWQDGRYEGYLSFNGEFLIVGERNKLYSVDIKNKKVVWEKELIPSGLIKEIKSNKDIITVYSETDKGGIIFVFNKRGDMITKFYSDIEEIIISPDNIWIAGVKDNQLKLFKLSEGFKRSFSGDEILENISFAPDSKKLIVSSILGTFYIIDINGNKIFEKDIGERNIGKWINDNVCIIGTWMGKLYKLVDNKNLLLITKLFTDKETKRVNFEKEEIPVIRLNDWGNSEKVSFSIKDNVFNKGNVRIYFAGKPSLTATREDYAEIKNLEKMIDGDPHPPESPYLPWTFINWMAETIPFGYLVFDGFNTSYKIKGITIFEDPEHPEFWLKDASFEYWNEENNRWVFVDYLVSNTPIHTHLFKKPVISSRFRIVMPSNFYSNLKFGEICFHGEAISCSHPDVMMKKEIVTLFDENDINFWREHFYPQNLIDIGFQGPISGQKYLIVKKGLQGPIWRPPFGHAIRNWNFEIVENPKDGQYRYLQFYWKKLNPDTKNFTLIFNGFAFYVGEYKGPSWYKAMKIADEIPSEWKLERIDLWDFLKKEIKITTISFITDGEIAIDKMVLAKGKRDLDELK
ncbi:MAG: WD40 repeat domain-containing protein [Candidatus Omnitrophica bacterium]|nr:WD40 repeat domain-containing protein [Candidatus Omnitrophota bacterium]MCM8802264.1 WD40 repeat domain-containing protein [Candidatus Omnitrophota bacterium]